MEGSANYFSRRAHEERETAMKAVHPKARRAHRQMAERYGDLADGIASGEPGLGTDAAVGS